MRLLSAVVASTMLSSPAIAQRPGVVAAISAERDAGFESLAECETALGIPGRGAVAGASEAAAPRGSLFNRAAGNISRCEVIHGEARIVVYPKDTQPTRWPSTLPRGE